MTTENLRAVLLPEAELGAGNVLTRLLEHGAAPDGPAVAFDVDVNGHPACRYLTLGELRHVVVVPEYEIILGPTGKVRKFLMRQRHLSGTVATAWTTAG